MGHCMVLKADIGLFVHIHRLAVGLAYGAETLAQAVFDD